MEEIKNIEPADGKKKSENDSDGGVASIYDFAEVLVQAVIIIFVIFTFFFRVAGVDGSSMNNTLQNRDWLMLSSYSFTPKRGDIVVITQPNSVNVPLIKRVIATEGQKINIDFSKGIVYINDQAINEPYIKEPTHLSYDVKFPVTVPNGCVFVMGDNRNDSFDSRASGVGFIDTRYIVGKVEGRFIPIGHWKVN